MHLSVYGVGIPCLSLWERWPSAARTERANGVCADAPAEVQAQAEYVTAPLREDGLYRAMVHMGLLHE